MIIPVEIRKKYDSMTDELNLLKKDIDPLIYKIAEENEGYYISRVKPIESYILKIESGKFNPDNIIDLFAATIVIPSIENMSEIENKISTKFVIHKKIFNRRKPPEAFIYDDVHLHISFNPTLIIPEKQYLSRKFELQIKTFLQYSWSKATHNLLYKTDEVFWPKYRVAYQIKAMLEQSELILHQIEKTAGLFPDNEYKEFQELNEVIKYINNTWKDEQLPNNLRRLAENILNLISAFGITLETLHEETMKTENQDLITAKSVTPYQAIVGILIRNDYSLLVECVRSKFKLPITQALRDILGEVPNEVMAQQIILD